MKKGFTLVELLLVMSILGVIIMIVIRHQTILNYRNIYAGYEKKATEDVVHATNLVMIKNPALSSYIDIAKNGTAINTPADCASGELQCLRAFFSTVIKGNPCGNAGEAACTTGEAFNVCSRLGDDKAGDESGNGSCRGGNKYQKPNGTDLTAPSIGLRMKNGEIIMFGDGTDETNTDCTTDPNVPCFFIYVDMNGKKGPNTYKQDRYRFKLYKDYVALDDSVDVPYFNIYAMTPEEQQCFSEIEAKYLSIRHSSPNDDLVTCFNAAQPITKNIMNKCKNTQGHNFPSCSNLKP